MDEFVIDVFCVLEASCVVRSARVNAPNVSPRITYHMRFRLFFRLDILSGSEYSFSRNIFPVRDAESAKEAARARRLRPGRAQPRAMKFGHRFQQVIEQTHPSVSDQVRSRAARVTPRGCRNRPTRWRFIRSRSVRAARRVRPSRVSRRARARASPRAVTRRGAPTPHPPGRRLAAPEPGCPPSLTTPLDPNTTGSSRFFSFRSSCATKP